MSQTVYTYKKNTPYGEYTTWTQKKEAIPSSDITIGDFMKELVLPLSWKDKYSRESSSPV